MKANYLPKNRSKHLFFRPVLALVIVLISGAIIFSVLDRTIISAVAPAWRAENVIIRSWRSGLAFFSSRQALSAENTALKERLTSLELSILSMSKNSIQEDTILEWAGRRQVSNMIVAAVLTHPPQTPYDTVVIDAGSNDSVALGSTVSLPEGPVLGTISEVFPKLARVKLFSASGEETNAILERNSVPITLVGAGGGNFKLMLPRDIAIEVGDRILVANITARLLGIVGDVSIEPTDAFKQVLAKSPANIFALRFVFVTP